MKNELFGQFQSMQQLQKNGTAVKNQFEIFTSKGKIFQSYNTIIAFIDRENDKIYLDGEKWNYSTTTGKYRNSFLNMSKKDIEKKIKSGEIILADLN